MKTLYRSKDNKVIAGVCGGLANFLSIDVSLVRLVCFMLIFFGGMSFWVYLAAAIFIPVEPERWDDVKRHANPMPSSAEPVEDPTRRAPILDGGQSSLDDLSPQDDSGRTHGRLAGLLILLGIIGLVAGFSNRGILLPSVLILAGLYFFTRREKIH